MHVQSDLRASIETDLANIKLCIASYQEQIARLTCQKRLLLEQVLKADAKVAEEKGVARSLAKELRKATAQAESLQHQLGEARAAAAHANQTAVEAVARAREAEGQRQKRGQVGNLNESGTAIALLFPIFASRDTSPLLRPLLPHLTWRDARLLSHCARISIDPAPQHAGSAPLPEQSPWGEQDQAGLYEDETWAAVPQEENILPRIMRLWEDLHVPLIHRSRFVLAFRGKETFYFEAEHRRLEWIKSQLEAGAASSRPGLEREVERAAR